MKTFGAFDVPILETKQVSPENYQLHNIMEKLEEISIQNGKLQHRMMRSERIIQDFRENNREIQKNNPLMEKEIIRMSRGVHSIKPDDDFPF